MRPFWRSAAAGGGAALLGVAAAVWAASASGPVGRARHLSELERRVSAFEKRLEDLPEFDRVVLCVTRASRIRCVGRVLFAAHLAELRGLLQRAFPDTTCDDAVEVMVPSWREVRIGPMSVCAPPAVTGHEGGGLDSIVGSLESPRLEAHFDCTVVRGEGATGNPDFSYTRKAHPEARIEEVSCDSGRAWLLTYDEISEGAFLAERGVFDAQRQCWVLSRLDACALVQLRTEPTHWWLLRAHFYCVDGSDRALAKDIVCSLRFERHEPSSEQQ